MHEYGVRDVEKLLRLPRSTIRALVAAGFVTPRRGARNAWRFSFQDLIALRTAQALAAARVPPRRISRSVKALRRHLPEAMPLSGLAICAVGDRVVVREGGSRWQADSGQYLLAFDGDPDAGSLTVIEGPAAPPPAADAARWFAHGLACEGAGDAAGARRAYEQALARDSACLDAAINLGRLLHEAGELADAERIYAGAMAAGGVDALLCFNLGVLLEDLGRRDEAAAAYASALRLDAGLADAHYNLALLCEALDRPQEAIRHMSEYRRLARRGP